MRYRTLGRTGLQVSELGLGGLFTSALGPGFEASREAVHTALELGINYIDTAPGYANSEEVLGQILVGEKSVVGNGPLVISTKLGGRPRPFNPRDESQLRYSLQESLRFLHREVIDVLILHEPDRPGQYAWWTKPQEVYGPVVDVLDKMKKEGLIRFTGLGGTTSTELAHYMRSDRFDVVLTAFNYSALFREATHEILPAAQSQKMGIVLGSVLQQGALGRRYDAALEKKPLWMAKARHEQFLEFYRFLDEIGISIVELCLRFAISNPEISSVLIGPKTAEQIRESVQAVEKGALSNDILKRLDEIANRVPFRPFEEPMILPINRPDSYYGPGIANLGVGVPVGK